MKKRTKIIIGIFATFLVLGIVGSFFGSDDSAVQSNDVESISNNDSSSDSSVLPDDASALSPDFPDAIDGVDISFASSINDDSTKKWRLARVASSTDTVDYALDYYQHFFSDDDEIHWIVNFTLNTTTCLHVSDGQLFVSEYEYVKGEELSAKKIGGGTLLSEYVINIANGDLETLQ